MLSDSCESSPVFFAARLARFSGFAFQDEIAGFRPEELEARAAFGVFFPVGFSPVAFFPPAFLATAFFFFAVFFAAAFRVRVAFFFDDLLFELDFV